MARRGRTKANRGRRAHTTSVREPQGGRELVDYLARGLVDDPEGVQVTESPRGDSTVLELRVAMNDLGKVIGKSGRTAQAMRTLLSLSDHESEASLDIRD